MPTTLIDCESIPLTNRDFRKWMDDAGKRIEELDEQDTDIWTRYYLSMNDVERDKQLHNLKWDLIGLKLEIQAAMSLWGQLRDEMD